MGQVVPSDLAKNLLPGLRTEFMQAYKEIARPFERISTLVPSTHLSEDYTWLGQTPGMREFGAERIPKGLSEFTYTIRNKKWEASVRVDNDSLRFEQYGQIKARVNGLARAIPRHKKKLVFELLEAGATTTGYDAQFFFDTDHSEGNSGTQSNKGTTALSAASYAAARAAIRKFKDDQGELLGIG